MNGLLMVFTGKGKGKTTSAMGAVLRAVGNGWRVCVIQFIKGNWQTGEQRAIERFGELVDFHVLGRGFTWDSDDIERDIEAARNAWAFAKDVIRSGRYRLIVLDELTYLIKYRMVAEEEIVRVLADRPPELNLIVTGRDAPESLIDIADLVTEMNEVKHHFHEGVGARRGIEF